MHVGTYCVYVAGQLSMRIIMSISRGIKDKDLAELIKGLHIQYVGTQLQAYLHVTVREDATCRHRYIDCM